MMKRKTYQQQVLIGRRKRLALLETTIKEQCTTFTVKQEGCVIATRSTSRTQDEETALMRLSKAVNGLAYVYVVPVPYQKDDAKTRYFKVNN